jgi:hypothetical protein
MENLVSKKISEIVNIPVGDIDEFDGNPNVQDPNTFTNLVKEIEEDGFDEAIVVVRNKKDKRYTVVSGNHRLKAAKILAFSEIPCIIKENWDLDKQKFKVVRRNLLKGELDPAKFTKLVNSLENNYTPEELAEAMGFNTTDDFERMYMLEQEMEQRQAGAIAAQIAEKETNAVDGLGVILNRLFSEYGDTVPHSFMFFSFGDKIHTMVMMNSKLKMAFEEIALKTAKEGLDINEVLSSCIVEGAASIGLGSGADLSKISSKNAITEDYELKAVTKK